MKWYAYLFIPIGKWLANTILIIAFFTYIYQNPGAVWIDLAIGWLLSALVAAGVAYLAFKNKLPKDRELGILLVSWIIITIMLEGMSSILAFTPLELVILRYEFFVQILLEVMSVLLIARVLRRQAAYHQTLPDLEPKN